MLLWTCQQYLCVLILLFNFQLLPCFSSNWDAKRDNVYSITVTISGHVKAHIYCPYGNCVWNFLAVAMGLQLKELAAFKTSTGPPYWQDYYDVVQVYLKKVNKMYCWISLVRPGKVDFFLFPISHFLNFEAGRRSLFIIDYAEVNVFPGKTLLKIIRGIKHFRITCKYV